MKRIIVLPLCLAIIFYYIAIVYGGFTQAELEWAFASSDNVTNIADMVLGGQESDDSELFVCRTADPKGTVPTRILFFLLHTIKCWLINPSINFKSLKARRIGNLKASA